MRPREISAAHGHATEPPSLRHRLREATAGLHARVDRHMGGLLQHAPDGYARFLSATACAVLPLEHALNKAGVAALLPDWPQRARSPALLADLAELHLPVPAEPDACATLPLESEAFAFGVLYVLEGSRLGARYILRELEDKQLPTRYLSHGEGQPFWPVFIRCLEESRAVRQDHAAAVAGATAAFNLFLPHDIQDATSAGTRSARAASGPYAGRR
jgi:heme oxygenase